MGSYGELPKSYGELPKSYGELRGVTKIDQVEPKSRKFDKFGNLGNILRMHVFPSDFQKKSKFEGYERI